MIYCFKRSNASPRTRDASSDFFNTSVSRDSIRSILRKMCIRDSLKWVDGERREVKVRDGEAIQLANSKIDEILPKRLGIDEKLQKIPVKIAVFQRVAPPEARDFRHALIPDKQDGDHLRGAQCAELLQSRLKRHVSWEKRSTV